MLKAIKSLEENLNKLENVTNNPDVLDCLNDAKRDLYKIQEDQRFSGDVLKKDNPWSFVERFYPDYCHCDDIAHDDDLEKLVNGEYEDGDCAHELLKSEYGGDLNNPQIKIDRDSWRMEIYESAIEGFLNQFATK